MNTNARGHLFVCLLFILSDSPMFVGWHRFISKGNLGAKLAENQPFVCGLPWIFLIFNNLGDFCEGRSSTLN